MQRISHANGVVTYTFDSLAYLPVCAHVSTRHGGVSPEPWRSLNFSVLRGDTPERVREIWQNGCRYGGYTLSTRHDWDGRPLLIEQRTPASRFWLPIVFD